MSIKVVKCTIEMIEVTFLSSEVLGRAAPVGLRWEPVPPGSGWLEPPTPFALDARSAIYFVQGKLSA